MSLNRVDDLLRFMDNEQKSNNNNNSEEQSSSSKTNAVIKVLLVVSSFTDMPATAQQTADSVTPEKTGWYIPEVAHPYSKFKSAGYDTTFVSPKGGVAYADVSSLAAYAKDDECNQFKHECMVEDGTGVQTVTIAEVQNINEYQVIFFAGGHGVMWDFPDCQTQSDAAAALYENGGVVCAVCHGPAALVNVKLSNGDYLVKGKLVTGFTNAEEDAVQKSEVMPFMLETVLKERGGKFVSMSNWADNTITDGRLVTGQNPASAHSCADAIIRILA